MALNPVKVQNYTATSFLGRSSNKPIAGIATNVNRLTVSQAKLVSDTLVAAGSPVKVTNGGVSTATGAGQELNPNVLQAVPATAAADVSGFLLVNETDILQTGEKAPHAYSGQLVNVALLGSLTELYLPCDTSVQNVSLTSKLAWDFTNNVAQVSATGTINIIGPVVDGVRFKVDTTNNEVVFEDCKVVKVRL